MVLPGQSSGLRIPPWIRASACSEKVRVLLSCTIVSHPGTFACRVHAQFLDSFCTRNSLQKWAVIYSCVGVCFFFAGFFFFFWCVFTFSLVFSNLQFSVAAASGLWFLPIFSVSLQSCRVLLIILNPTLVLLLHEPSVTPSFGWNLGYHSLIGCFSGPGGPWSGSFEPWPCVATLGSSLSPMPSLPAAQPGAPTWSPFSWLLSCLTPRVRAEAGSPALRVGPHSPSSPAFPPQATF